MTTICSAARRKFVGSLGRFESWWRMIAVVIQARKEGSRAFRFSLISKWHAKKYFRYVLYYTILTLTILMDKRVVCLERFLSYPG